MAKLLILKGLPASGKSTYARELIRDPDWRRVSRDDLRTMFNNYDYANSDEKLVNVVYLEAVRVALKTGYNVVSDACNLDARSEKALRMIARDYDADVEVKFFDVPLEECIARDSMRVPHNPKSRYVGEEAIRRFHDRYLASGNFRVENPLPDPEPTAPYTPDPSLPPAIVVDVDGTLALKGDRSPYDWARCGEDEVCGEVKQVLTMLTNTWNGPYVILLSGRDSVCRPETENWLWQNDIPHEELHMRAEGDMRKDTIVKRELFDTHLRGRYNVQFVIDDRPSVCRMWREMGLFVFQVGDPHKEF